MFRYQLRFACANLLQELRTLDLPEIVASEALPALALHFEKIIRAEESLTEIKISFEVFLVSIWFL